MNKKIVLQVATSFYQVSVREIYVSYRHLSCYGNSLEKLPKRDNNENMQKERHMNLTATNIISVDITFR